ncbi:branched-chain amino acid transaminase [Geminicoccaceae bacterium 1502E]|nr:branched-chain amino acid transaminase [Geminicoccaceae bacterium 1502E]
MLTDLADQPGTLWVDGSFAPWTEAKLHVLSHSLHFAGSVFEGIRVYGGRAFALHQHLERLAASAEMLGYRLPWTVEMLEETCHALLARQELAEGYIRPIAWRGSQSVSVPAAGCRVHVAIAAFPWPSYYGEEQRRRGLRLAVARWKRPSPETAPTASKTAGLYTIATMARDEANAAGFDDALMLDWRGLLAEATGANLFLVIDGSLHTPLPDCFLDGITRRTVIGLARARGLEVVERHMAPGELDRAQGAFLTGTAVEIMPVAAIGERELDPAHRLIRMLAADYAALVRGEDPAPTP